MSKQARINIHTVPGVPPRGQVLRRGQQLVAVVLAVAALGGCSRVPGVLTYVSADAKASSAAGEEGPFKAKAYVDKAWDDKILPTVADKAVDLPTLLKAVASDKEAAGKQYGHQSGTGSPFAFLTRVTGTVTDVDTSAPQRPMTLRVAGVPGGTTVQVVTGQVIAGTALRDAVGFISFSDFTNQLDYADVATELNTRVKKDVLAGLQPAQLKGKQVTVEGAFSLITPQALLIIPTQVEAAP